MVDETVDDRAPSRSTLKVCSQCGHTWYSGPYSLVYEARHWNGDITVDPQRAHQDDSSHCYSECTECYSNTPAPGIPYTERPS